MRALTPKSLSERWECSERHIRNLVKDGKLKCFRAGVLVRFSLDDVVEYERGGNPPRPSPEATRLSVATELARKDWENADRWLRERIEFALKRGDLPPPPGDAP